MKNLIFCVNAGFFESHMKGLGGALQYDLISEFHTS